MRSLRRPSLRGAALPLLASLAVGCSTSLPDKTPIQTGPMELSRDEWRVTDQVLIYTDGSGTMWVNETFPDAKALTRSFVSAMPERNVESASGGGYSAGLVGFGGDERSEAPLAPFDRGALSSRAASLEVMGALDGRGGTTPYAAVLTEASNSLRGKRGRAAVVFFSDGVPDDETAALQAAKNLLEGYSDGVCIHGVHTGTNQEGYAFLKRLAQMSKCGGVRTASEFSSAFEVQQFAKAVLVGPANRPPPVAAGPCEGGTLRLRGIEFEFDRATLTADSKPVLDVAAEELARCPEVRVTVSGHTDSTGSESYNMELSHRRAMSTRDYLVKSGIDAGRLETEGRGESQPIATNETKAGRSQNRRVELSPLR